jgi:TolB-like protein/DNA-binding winged helix-turn-helix (wHTH) protein
MQTAGEYGYSFLGFVLDLRRSRLTHGAKEIPLRPKTFTVLHHLVENADRLVSKDELISAVWGNVVATDESLTRCISELRQAIGDCEREIIKTISRRGYFFSVPVTPVIVNSAMGDDGLATTNARPDEGKTTYLTHDEERPGGQPAHHATLFFATSRLSIVVLPLIDLSEDREQQYFADAITDDLTTDLSRIANIFVIARSTSFTYRERSLGVKAIGRELGVRYVLEGSVRRAGSQVRLNLQLVDAESEAHIWVGRFDRLISEVISLESEVTSQVAIALNLEMILAEASRRVVHPDALDYVFRARAESWKPRTPSTHAETIRLFECALGLDPDSIEARCWLADALISQANLGLAPSVAAAVERARDLVAHAAAVAPRNPLVHYVKGELCRVEGQFADAIPEYQSVLIANRNWASAHSHLGWCRFLTGSRADLIPSQEQAMRLSPRDPAIRLWYFRIGLAHLLDNRFQEAIQWFEESRRAAPGLPLIHSYLAAAHALNGDRERATAALAEAQRLSGNGGFDSLASIKGAAFFRPTTISDMLEASYFAGLRRAGLPDV